MGMQYGHIIYTRRSCGTGLDGKISEGLGIFSMTQNVMDDTHDNDLINKVLDAKRMPDDLLETEYIYFVPPYGAPMLGKYRNRTREECEAAEKAGVDSRMVHISEWITGTLEQYPFEYIDSPYFSADREPMAFYYPKETCPIGAPVPAEEVPTGYTDRQAVMQFAADRREDAVRSGVAFLLQQFALPPEQRKFLVIRDTEPNVRKWIAAICYSFPVAAAREISFETRMPNINQDTSTTYYVTKNTQKFVRIRNVQDPNQARRCFVMIAGADPQDRTCSNSANPMPNSPYAVIDGESRKARFTVDELAGKAYLRNLVSQDKTIENFCRFLDQMKDIRLDASLCDLFDAYQVIDRESWEYDSLVQAIRQFQPHFTADSFLLRHIMDQLCEGNKYTEQFAEADERNGLQLFGLLSRIGTEFGMNDKVNSLREAVIDRFNLLLGTVDKGRSLQSFTGTLKQAEPAFYQTLVNQIAVDRKLSIIPVRELENAPDEYFTGLLNVMNDVQMPGSESWTTFLTYPDYADLAEALVRKCSTNDRLVKMVLGSTLGQAKAVDAFVILGSKTTNGKRETSRWWRCMLENNVPVEQLCDIMHRGGAATEDIENVICAALKTRGPGEKLKSLFNQYLARVPGAGQKYCRELIAAARKSPNRNSELEKALKDMAMNSNFSGLLAETLTSLDEDVIFDQNRENAELVRILTEMTTRARVTCPNMLLWNYLDQMTKAKIAFRGSDPIFRTYHAVNPSGKQYAAPYGIQKTPMGKSYLEKMLENCEDPAAHLILLMSFSFANRDGNMLLIGEYADDVTANSLRHKNNGIASIVYLYDIVSRRQLQSGEIGQLAGQYDFQAVQSQVNELMEAVKKALCKTRTDNVREKMVTRADKDFGPAIGKLMDKLFEEAGETYRENHKEGFLSKLFGGFRKE